MAVAVQDTLFDLERHRLRLEQNVAKLRTALHHWQTWEVEYEGIKEEIEHLPRSASHDDMRKIAEDFGGDLVKGKDGGEIREILGLDRSLARSKSQVVDILSKRIDYVHRNVETLQKQLDAAALKLSGLSVVSKPDVFNEEGLPMTEITEELDDDGNVISSRVSNPADTTAQMFEALKKAGIKEKDLNQVQESSKVEQVLAESHRRSDSVLGEEESIAPLLPVADVAPRKASVSSAEGTSAGEARDTDSLPPKNEEAYARATKATTDLARGSFKPTDRVVELDADDKPVSVSTTAMPPGDSPEEAEMRRQMLQYSMNEVNSIVAQLDLEEDSAGSASDGGIDDGGDDDDGQDNRSTSSADDEDSHGLSRKSLLSDDYRREMLALEARLNAQMFTNVGRTADELDPDQRLAQDARKLIIQRDPAPASNFDTPARPSGGRSVRFAPDVDVAPPPPEPTVHNTAAEPRGLIQPTAIQDTIVERATPSAASAMLVLTPRKVSRFKSGRAVQTGGSSVSSRSALADDDNDDSAVVQPISTPMPLQQNPPPTLAAQVVERPAREGTEVLAPSDLVVDPALVRQEVAVEYYRRRNQMIHKQGGFVRQREELQNEADSYMDHEEDSGGEDAPPRRKVSLFKAARLKRDA